MLMARIIPRRFGSRLLLMTLFTGLIPVVIFTLLIQTSSDRFKNEINQAVQSGRDQEWRRSEALLRQQGEEQIRAKATDVAVQLNLVLRSVPWMTLQDLQRDGKFHKVAVQPVGRTGYTFLYETRTGISRFHGDRKYENVNLRRFSKSLPAFWAIVRKSLRGMVADGYYDWKEPDGHLRQKYMYAIPLTVRTGDGVRLTLAATAYVDEFTQAIREAEVVHQDTTRFLAGTIGTSIQALRKTGLTAMGLGIVVACLLALCAGRYFSRTIGRLRDATSRVIAGDYAVRVRSSMSGEIGTLVADFNTMVAQLEATTVSKHLLEESEEKFRQANAELELRVAERTAKLSESEQRYRELVELLPEVVFETDVDGFYTYANRRALEAFGYTAEELRTGIHMRDVVAPRDYARITENAGRILAGDVREGDEYILRRKDGIEFPVFIRAARIVQDGSIVGLRGIVVDLTQSRRAEEEKLRLEEQVRQAQKMEAMGTLAGGIAHDFNNILAAIIGFSEMAVDDAEKDSPQERHLQQVLKAGIRGRDLVRQILTFSRKSDQEKMPVKLSDVARESLELLRASLPSTIGIRFNVISEAGQVMADPVQIQQVIINICSNAAHAMRNNRAAIAITLSDFSLLRGESAPEPAMKPGHYLKLTISDTGEGMPSEVVQRIFDPFFTTKGPGEGTGLGLSVVHGIVESHGGTIMVESEPGKGSTFTVYLPRLIEDNQETAEIDDVPVGGHERILFVDDEKLVVQMGEEVLSALGYGIVSKTSSREALMLFRDDPRRFDLVITDQTMPDITGIELAREILAIRPDMPVILCTGFSHLVDAESAKQAGVRAFAMKPLRKGEIARTIRKALDE